MPHEPSDSRCPRSLTILLGLCLAWGLLACSGASTSEDRATIAKRKEIEDKWGADYDAKHFAEKIIVRFLKWPDDAEFPWGTQVAERLPQVGHRHPWRVAGKVKAKNGFGALLTHEYQVVLYRDSSSIWKALYANLQGEVVHVDADYLAEFEGQINEIDKANKETKKDQEQRKEFSDDFFSDRAEDSDDSDKQPENLAQQQEQEPAREAHDADESRLRTWKSSDGTFSVVARFSGSVNGSVKLVKEDGREIQVPLEKLSDEDQHFIRDKR